MLCHFAIRRSRRQDRGAFTLMEVLLVLAILVILGSIAVFSFRDTLFGAKTKTAKIAIDALKVPIQQFLLDEGRYPDSLAELSNISPTTNRKYVDIPVKTDPWGREYIYESPQTTADNYRLSSVGEDGQQGTADDVTSWQ